MSCDGTCCRTIDLLPPGAIQDALTRHRAGHSTDSGGDPIPADVEAIADMLVPIGRSEYDPRTGKRFPEGRRHLYDCKHLTADGRCDNYTNRPAFCRRFPPPGTRCTYCGESG